MFGRFERFVIQKLGARLQPNRERRKSTPIASYEVKLKRTAHVTNRSKSQVQNVVDEFDTGSSTIKPFASDPERRPKHLLLWRQ